METVYDSIISLGGFCGAAVQLRARGLRKFSLPLDWLFMDDPKTIDYLIKAFSSDFSDFMLKENLVPIVYGPQAKAAFQYKDTLSGYNFVHHFHKDIKDGGYEEVKAIMDRRFKRFFSLFAPNKKVLLLLSLQIHVEAKALEKLLNTIRAAYPQTKIDLYVIELNAAFEKDTIVAENFPKDLSFTGTRYKRGISEYDNSITSYEWSFLDFIHLTKGEVDRPRGVDKWIYKIWKSMGKYLRDKGYRCFGARFAKY